MCICRNDGRESVRNGRRRHIEKYRLAASANFSAGRGLAQLVLRIGSTCTVHRANLYPASHRLVLHIALGARTRKTDRGGGNYWGRAASHSICRLGNPDSRGQAALRRRTPMRANFGSTCPRRRHHAVGPFRAPGAAASRRGKSHRDVVLRRNVARNRRPWSASR